MIAYTGRYRVEPPNRFVADIAWLPARVGTPRAGTFTIRDGTLDNVADPAPVEFLDGAMAIGVPTAGIDVKRGFQTRGKTPSRPRR